MIILFEISNKIKMTDLIACPQMTFTIDTLQKEQEIYHKTRAFLNKTQLLIFDIRAKILSERIAPTNLDFNDLHSIRLHVDDFKSSPLYVQYIFGQFMESWKHLENGDLQKCDAAFLNADKLFELYMYLTIDKNQRNI